MEGNKEERKERQAFWLLPGRIAEAVRDVGELCLPLDRLGQRGLFYPKLGRSQSPWPRETWGLARARPRRETA